MENQTPLELCPICSQQMTDHESRVLKTCYHCAEAEHIIETGCPTIVVGEEYNCAKSIKEKLRLLIERGWRPPITMY
jgi:hypothetical protein